MVDLLAGFVWKMTPIMLLIHYCNHKQEQKQGLDETSMPYRQMEPRSNHRIQRGRGQNQHDPGVSDLL